MVYALSGRVREAHQVLSDLNQGNGPRYVTALASAGVHAVLGEHEKAVELLEESYQERAASLVYTANHPMFERLHGDPHFEDLLRRIGVPRAATSASTTA